MIQSANRLEGYFDDPVSSAVAPRTPAQRAAARRNGKMSKGPTTAAGKAIACRNAQKHGLLARVIQPPDDYRGLQRDYRRIRAALVAQYNPRSFTQNAEIDGLASDMLRAARARAIIEAAMCPPALLPRVQAAWRKIPAAQARLRAARHALKALERSELPLLPEPAAERLAGRLTELVTAVVADVAAADAEAAEAAAEAADAVGDQADADAAEGANSDTAAEGTEGAAEADTKNDPKATSPKPAPAGPSKGVFAAAARARAEEAAELEKLRAMIATLGKAIAKFQKTEYVAGLLTGERTITSHSRKCLMTILRDHIANTSNWLAGQKDVRGEVERANTDNLTALARTPQNLVLLEDYLTRIERHVRRAKERLDQH